MNEIFKIELGKFIYKFNSNRIPDGFQNYFVPITSTHSHNTRTSINNFFVPRKNCNKGLSGLNYLGPRLWSEIPDVIKEKKHT